MIFETLAGCGALGLLWGHVEAKSLRVVHTRHASSLIPSNFNGYRIALLGGLHIEAMDKRIRKLQAILRDLHPDILLLAGNVKPSHGAENARIHALLKEFLSPLEMPDGTLAVRGYHDRKHFWAELPKDSPCHLLTNSSIRISRGEEAIDFLGIHTPHACHLDRGLGQLRKTLANMPEGNFRILLGQSGDLLRVAQGRPLQLILACDNLHYQMRIPGIGVPRRDSKATLRWERGWIREGKKTMYLTSGVGTYHWPFRFFLRPELTIIELVCAPESKGS